jgi:hypothetical protein
VRNNKNQLQKGRIKMEWTRGNIYNLKDYGIDQNGKYCGFIDEPGGHIRSHRFLLDDGRVWKTYTCEIPGDHLNHFLYLTNSKVVGITDV